MRAILIYNPKSGRQRFKHHIPYIQRRFAAAGYSLAIQQSKKPKDLIALTKSAANDPYDLILIAGGDGSLNEAINGLMQSDKTPVLGYFPAGTTNDMGSVLKLSKNVKNAVNTILEGDVVKMDVVRMNHLFYGYVAAAGKFTNVSYDVPSRFKLKYGKLAYFFQGIKQLTHDVKIPMTITVDDDEVIKSDIALILLLNMPHVGGFYLRRLRPSKLNDGLIEMNLFERVKRKTSIRIASLLLMGERRIKGVYNSRAKRYKINVPDDVVWNIDGEKALNGSVEVEVMKEAISIYVPKKTKKKYF